MDPVNVPAKFEVGEIIAIEVLGGSCEPQPWGRGGRRGSGCYHSKERCWVPMGPPYELFLYLYAFQRYCRFCAPASHFFPPHIVSPKFPHVLMGVGDGLWATKSEGVGLIVRAIIFQDFQPVRSWSINVTDRRTDRRHVIAIPRFAL